MLSSGKDMTLSVADLERINGWTYTADRMKLTKALLEAKGLNAQVWIKLYGLIWGLTAIRFVCIGNGDFRGWS